MRISLALLWIASLSIHYSVASSQKSQQQQQSVIVAKDATVNGLKLHYLEANSSGSDTVILLHGYTQTSRMWRPLMPRLASRFRVIAPDLPGIGDSDVVKSRTGAQGLKPKVFSGSIGEAKASPFYPVGDQAARDDKGKRAHGSSSQSASFGASAATAATMDMKTAAVIIHDLARKLGVSKARVVGHDIGLMVAYAYAAQFPGEVEKLVLMDAFLPGIGDWEETYNDPRIWHFRFNGPTPEALVRGRERLYFEHYWNDFAADKTHSLPEADRAAYTAAYARPGRLRASWEYFKSFPDDAKDFQKFAQTKLAMPVLSLGGEMSRGDRLGGEVQQVGTNVTVIALKGSGHWVMEEKAQETMEALEKFLTQ